MSWPNECWFNVYANGNRGMLHASRGQCETAGFPSYMETEEAGAAYRVHVVLKPSAPPQPPAVLNNGAD